MWLIQAPYLGTIPLRIKAKNVPKISKTINTQVALRCVEVSLFSGSLSEIPAMKKPRKADTFNTAFAVYLEWGPATETPLRERIAKAIPGLRPAEIKKLIAEFDGLLSAACRTVEEKVERHQAEDDMRRSVADLDPRISAENASVLYNQARYSAWRDGFR